MIGILSQISHTLFYSYDYNNISGKFYLYKSQVILLGALDIIGHKLTKR